MATQTITEASTALSDLLDLPSGTVLHLRGGDSSAASAHSSAPPSESLVLQLKGAPQVSQAATATANATSDLQSELATDLTATTTTVAPKEPTSQPIQIQAQEANELDNWLETLMRYTTPTVPEDWFRSQVSKSQEPGHRIKGTNWDYSCAELAGNAKTEDRIGLHEWEMADGTTMVFNGLYDGHGGGKKKAMVSDFANKIGGDIMESTFRDGRPNQTTRELFETGLRKIHSTIKDNYHGVSKNGKLLGGAMATASLLVPSENKVYLANDGDSEITCTFRDDQGNRVIKAMFDEDTYKSSHQQERVHKFLKDTYGNERYGLVKDRGGTMRLGGSLMPFSGLGDHDYDHLGFGHEWKIREVDIEGGEDGTLEWVIQTTDGLGDAHTMRNGHNEVSRGEYWTKTVDAMTRPLDVPGVKDDQAARALFDAVGHGTDQEIWSIAPGSARGLGRDDMALSALFNNPEGSKSSYAATTKFIDMANVPVDICTN